MTEDARYELLQLARGKGITPLDAVQALYPQSKQPFKQAETFARRLEEMVRTCFLRAFPGPNGSRLTTRYVLTAFGRTARAEEERDRERLQEPAYPRLASD
jgi:hypothetical protein